MSGTTGFFAPGELGNSSLEAEGTSAIPSTFGEAVGAQFSQAFSENVGTRLARRAWRNLDSTVREYQPDELNAEFSVPGRLTFDQPTTRAVAQDLYEHHRANALRADTIARRGDAVGGGMGFGILTGLGAGLLDPLNIAASFIPVVGEANLARMLGVGAGAAGRAAVRGVKGAVEGFVGTAALEPLNALLTIQDRDDYTMGTALANLGVGTVLGGALHTGVGALRDRRGLPPWSPEMNDAARVRAIADLVEGRPVSAGEAMDFVAANEGSTQLRKWYDTQRTLTQQGDEALGRSLSRDEAAGVARQRLDDLNAEAVRIKAELDDANLRLRDNGMDPVTQDRVEAIDAELSGNVSRKRRQALEAERQMLNEGIDWQDADLQNARTQSEVDGLTAEQRRLNSRVRLAELNYERATKTVEAANTVLEQNQAAMAARQSVVSELTMRTLRQTAAKLGVALAPDEVFAVAQRITRASPQEVQGVIDRELRAITERAVGPFRPDQGVFVEPPTNAQLEATMQALDANRQRSSDQLAGTTRNDGTKTPQGDARVVDGIVERAPKVEGTSAEQLVLVDKQNAELTQMLQAQEAQEAAAAVREGREAPAPSPELEAARAMQAEGESLAKAYEAAAVCMIGVR